MHNEIDELIACLTSLKSNIPNLITTMVDTVSASLSGGGKIFFCGNGGSAAEAQHMAAEYAGTLMHTNLRKGLPAIALTTDTSFITAWSNDFEFETIFSRQLETLGKADDILIVFTTSGNSLNILHAIKTANDIGLKTICFTGQDGGDAKEIADLTFRAPSNNTPRVQELHTVVGHILCKYVEKQLGYEFENV